MRALLLLCLVLVSSLPSEAVKARRAAATGGPCDSVKTNNKNIDDFCVYLTSTDKKVNLFGDLVLSELKAAGGKITGKATTKSFFDKETVFTIDLSSSGFTFTSQAATITPAKFITNLNAKIDGAYQKVWDGVVNFLKDPLTVNTLSFQYASNTDWKARFQGTVAGVNFNAAYFKATDVFVLALTVSGDKIQKLIDAALDTSDNTKAFKLVTASALTMFIATGAVKDDMLQFAGLAKGTTESTFAMDFDFKINGGNVDNSNLKGLAAQLIKGASGTLSGRVSVSPSKVQLALNLPDYQFPNMPAGHTLLVKGSEFQLFWDKSDGKLKAGLATKLLWSTTGGTNAKFTATFNLAVDGTGTLNLEQDGDVAGPFNLPNVVSQGFKTNIVADPKLPAPFLKSGTFSGKLSVGQEIKDVSKAILVDTAMGFDIGNPTNNYIYGTIASMTLADILAAFGYTTADAAKTEISKLDSKLRSSALNNVKISMSASKQKITYNNAAIDVPAGLLVKADLVLFGDNGWKASLEGSYDASVPKATLMMDCASAIKMSGVEIYRDDQKNKGPLLNVIAGKVNNAWKLSGDLTAYVVVPTLVLKAGVKATLDNNNLVAQVKGSIFDSISADITLKSDWSGLSKATFDVTATFEVNKDSKAGVVTTIQKNVDWVLSFMPPGCSLETESELDADLEAEANQEFEARLEASSALDAARNQMIQQLYDEAEAEAQQTGESTSVLFQQKLDAWVQLTDNDMQRTQLQIPCAVTGLLEWAQSLRQWSITGTFNINSAANEYKTTIKYNVALAGKSMFDGSLDLTLKVDTGLNDLSGAALAYFKQKVKDLSGISL